jgi:hypothetical protein
MLDIGLYLFYALLGIAILSAIVFPVVNAISKPGALLRSLAGVGVLLVLFGIAYALSSDEVTKSQAASGVSGSGARMIGAGLILFYITLIGSALAVVYSEVSKALK